MFEREPQTPGARSDNFFVRDALASPETSTKLDICRSPSWFRHYDLSGIGEQLHVKHFLEIPFLISLA